MLKRASVVSAMVAGAVAMAPAANAATTVAVSSSNTSGWTIVSPGSSSPTNAIRVTSGLPPTWDSSAPWISIGPNGSTLRVPGESQYIFTLGTPTWLRSLSGQYWADNRLVGIMVRNSLGWVALPFTPISSNEQFTPAGLPARTFNFTSAIQGAGTISAIMFRANNLPLGGVNPNNPAAFASVGLGTAVPEPGTWLLMMLGLGAVGFAMRRQQKASVRLQFA